MINNCIMAIHPYYENGLWMFDDDATGLKKELLVAGVPEILEWLAAKKNIANPRNGFTVIFASTPFPNYDLEATHQRYESGGDVYAVETPLGTMEGWLCPALLKYFDAAPEKLFIQALPKGE